MALHIVYKGTGLNFCSANMLLCTRTINLLRIWYIENHLYIKEHSWFI